MVGVSVSSWSKLISVNTGTLNEGVSSMPGMLFNSMSKSLGRGRASLVSDWMWDWFVSA